MLRGAAVAKVKQDIWTDARAVIRKSVPQERFNLWFRNTELVEQDGDTCRIGVPNAFVANWLQEHFGDVVKGALGTITGRDVHVRFIVSPRLYRKVHEEELRQKEQLVEELDSTQGGQSPSAENPGREYRLEDFVVGASNRLAFAAALHVATNRDHSLNPLVIHGPVGLGKTHLLKGLCHRWNVDEPAAALYLSGESFTSQFLSGLQHKSLDGFRRKFRDISLLALDDLQFLASKPATQEEFLQIYNLLTNLNKQVVLACDSHPREIDRLKETLATRLVSGMIVQLESPEFETRLAILRKKLGKRCEFVPDEVLTFIAEKVHGSVRELEGAATTVVAMATLSGEKTNLATARRVVASLVPHRDVHVSAGTIEEEVARAYHVSVEDIHSSRRHKSVALPRHVAMYLARELTSLSWKEIGLHFGRRNHTGALFAYKKIKAALEQDAPLAEHVRRLRRRLGG